MREDKYPTNILVAIKFNNKIFMCISFVVFHPNAGRKWLIIVDKSCTSDPLVNVTSPSMRGQ